MDKECIKRYISAHSPMIEKSQARMEHYFYNYISIAELTNDANNFVPAFSHSHIDYEFIIPETPIPFLFYDGAVYYGEVGFVYPAYSGKEHGSKYPMSGIVHTNIVIDKDYFDIVLKHKNADINCFKQEFTLTEELRIYIKAFEKEFKKDSNKDILKMRYLTGLICSELAEGCVSASEVTLRENTLYRRGIYSVADYLNKNYENDISVSKMAQLCGLSVSYFTRAFREVIGCSPKKYLIKIRISKAKLLLENSDKQISEICSICGFKKQNSFTSLFKSINGLTPTEYRKNVKRLYLIKS